MMQPNAFSTDLACMACCRHAEPGATRPNIYDISYMAYMIYHICDHTVPCSDRRISVGATPAADARNACHAYCVLLYHRCTSSSSAGEPLTWRTSTCCCTSTASWPDPWRSGRCVGRGGSCLPRCPRGRPHLRHHHHHHYHHRRHWYIYPVAGGAAAQPLQPVSPAVHALLLPPPFAHSAVRGAAMAVTL